MALRTRLSLPRLGCACGHNHPNRAVLTTERTCCVPEGNSAVVAEENLCVESGRAPWSRRALGLFSDGWGVPTLHLFSPVRSRRSRRRFVAKSGTLPRHRMKEARSSHSGPSPGNPGKRPAKPSRRLCRVNELV